MSVYRATLLPLLRRWPILHWLCHKFANNNIQKCTRIRKNENGKIGGGNSDSAEAVTIKLFKGKVEEFQTTGRLEIQISLEESPDY